MIRLPPRSTLFPSTTLFRSLQAEDGIRDADVTGVQTCALPISSHVRISYAVFCLRSEEHTSELQSRPHLVCRLLLEKNKSIRTYSTPQTCWCHTITASAQPTLVYISSCFLICRDVVALIRPRLFCFFFNDTATTEIYPLSLHDALPISAEDGIRDADVTGVQTSALPLSSHVRISYAVFCL